MVILVDTKITYKPRQIIKYKSGTKEFTNGQPM